MHTKKHSIRNKIVIWAVGFALILAIAVAYASYVLSVRYLTENQQQSALTNIHVLGNDLDSDINTVLTFSNWICLDSTISNYLKNVDRAYTLDPSQGRKLSLNAWNHLNNEFNIVGVRNQIDRVIIATPNGTQFLQSISSGDAQSVTNVPMTIMDSVFFDELISAPSYRWDGFHDNPLSRTGTPKVLPIIRPIHSSSSYATIGWVYMDIPASVITGSLRSFVLAEDDALYLTFSPGNTYRYTKGDLVKDKVPEAAISYRLPNTGWTLSYLPSREALESRMRSYQLTILAIFMVILFAGIILSISLHRTITRPVERLISRLDKIGQGDFSRDEKIEWNNELGEIGRGINNLSENVSDLMDKRLLDEKAKHDLEYQILQSQINPHFLYNTLNTIKWMATIQGSEGIADMSTSLSRLMKNISKSNEDLIPLSDEFSLVDDYFTIMKYRYGGTIDLEYITDDEELLSQRINRFSLQPIIENAIFHGIEPKGSAGKITIHTHRDGDDVIIDVTDNGIGMSQEAIDNVLSGKSQTSTEFFKQIGVYNVNERIRYTFGDNYGIRIKSSPGEYTTMSFVLPYRENGSTADYK
jgi:two-component system sensor histidine kinase YesM